MARIAIFGILYSLYWFEHVKLVDLASILHNSKGITVELAYCSIEDKLQNIYNGIYFKTAPWAWLNLLKKTIMGNGT